MGGWGRQQADLQSAAVYGQRSGKNNPALTGEHSPMPPLHGNAPGNEFSTVVYNSKDITSFQWHHSRHNGYRLGVNSCQLLQRMDSITRSVCQSVTKNSLSSQFAQLENFNTVYLRS